MVGRQKRVQSQDFINLSQEITAKSGNKKTSASDRTHLCLYCMGKGKPQGAGSKGDCYFFTEHLVLKIDLKDH